MPATRMPIGARAAVYWAAATHEKRSAESPPGETGAAKWFPHCTKSDSAKAKCRKRRRSRAGKNLLQGGVVSGKVGGGIIQRHGALVQERLCLPVVQTKHRSEERRVGKECRSRWSPYH